MPVGPVALVSIDYGMRRGFVTSLWFGLGAALADAALALVAYLASEMVSDWLNHYHRWIAVSGALFLLYLGIRIIVTDPGKSAKGGRPFLTGIILTVANPMTVLAFVAFLAIANVSASWIPGVFVGSFAWWVVVAAVSSRLGHRLSDRAVRRVRQAGGALICALALWLGFH